MNAYLTIPEYAAEFRLHPETVREWARSGKIPGAIKTGRTWKIKRSETSRAELRGSLIA
jgi:excisionase family DNA binding protein